MSRWWDSHLLLVAGMLLVLACLAAGCSRSAPAGDRPVFVLGVQDEASGPLEGLRFDDADSRQALSRALADSRYLVEVDKRQADAYRAELVISLASERESDRAGELGVYRAVQVELQLHRTSKAGRERLSAQGKAFLVQDPDKTDRQEGFEQVLQLAVAKAVQLVDLQLQLRGLPAAELAQRLTDERPEVRLYALRSLRDRHLPELVPEVIRLLSDPDDDVILEAVGVLVAQRDRRAVLPLIRMSQTRDPIFQLQIITAVAELGGPVARGYLFTLAAGHGSTEIRQRAQEGLERLLQEERSAGPEQAEPNPAVDGRTVALPRSGFPDGGAGNRGGR